LQRTGVDLVKKRSNNDENMVEAVGGARVVCVMQL